MIMILCIKYFAVFKSEAKHIHRAKKNLKLNGKMYCLVAETLKTARTFR